MATDPLAAFRELLRPILVDIVRQTVHELLADTEGSEPPAGEAVAARDERLAVDETEAARILGISSALLAEQRKLGHVPAVKVGRRIVYRISDLEAFLESNVS